MSGNVADYVIVNDRSFNLVTGADIDRSFSVSLPGNTLVNQKGILTFQAETRADQVRLNAYVNGTQVTRLDIVKGKACHQQVVPKNLLRGGESNNIRFKVDFDVTPESISIDDIVLWFQNTV